jgi:ATP-dependent Clp protease ATP-binding subunit ClpA
MTAELNDSFFIRFGKRLTAHSSHQAPTIPFSDHAQFSTITDILCRRDNHHVFLCSDFSSKMHMFFLQAMLVYFNKDNTPASLHKAELIYLDLAHAIFLPPEEINLERDLFALSHILQDENKYILFALPAEMLLADRTPALLRRQLEALLTHPQCRFIFLGTSNDKKHSNHLTRRFTFLALNQPSEQEIKAILKHESSELENFHNVLISDSLLASAFKLAERYLSSGDTLDNALLLLDSGAARASVSGQTVALNEATLMEVLSAWTQIPSSHLGAHPFLLSKFMHEMQQQIFGQDAAITTLAQKLQQSQPHLHNHAGPFCTFLFAGPAHAGKKTLAHALTIQLFNQIKVLYYAQLAASRVTSIAEIRLQRSEEHHSTPLKDVIRETPHAVIMLENVDQASPAVLDGLFEIFSTGYLHDHDGNIYNFRQAIIILSTTLGSLRLAELTKIRKQQSELNTIELMQRSVTETEQTYSHQDMIQEIIPEITSCLPATLCQHLCIVPFLPLTQTVIEKIIRLKLKKLGKDISARYGIELGYAPEVIRFLGKDLLAKQNSNSQEADIKKVLQPLYFSVEQSVLSQSENPNRPNHLFLQLNETGQFLRCDFLTLDLMGACDAIHHLA